MSDQETGKMVWAKKDSHVELQVKGGVGSKGLLEYLQALPSLELPEGVADINRDLINAQRRALRASWRKMDKLFLSGGVIKTDGSVIYDGMTRIVSDEELILNRRQFKAFVNTLTEKGVIKSSVNQLGEHYGFGLDLSSLKGTEVIYLLADKVYRLVSAHAGLHGSLRVAIAGDIKAYIDLETPMTRLVEGIYVSRDILQDRLVPPRTVVKQRVYDYATDKEVLDVHFEASSHRRDRKKITIEGVMSKQIRTLLIELTVSPPEWVRQFMIQQILEATNEGDIDMARLSPALVSYMKAYHFYKQSISSR